MIFIINNITTQAVIGGSDNLLGIDLHEQLRMYLRVRPANYGMMLMQMRRRGVKGWDGFTYFINIKGIFPTGFLPLVIAFVESLGCKVTLQDERKNIPQMAEGGLNFEAPLGRLVKHQREAIKKTLFNTIGDVTFNRGIWDMATNSRKTATAGNLILNYENPSAIMLVDSADLLKQHIAYYRTVFTGKGEVGFITSTKQVIGSILTIAMVRTLYNRLKKSVTVQRDLNNKFNILLVDELHGYGSREAVYTINKINAGVRIGMSGTPLSGSDKVAKFRLIGMFGSVLHTVSKRYLMDNGFSLIPNVKILLNPTKSTAITYDAEMARVITESIERAEIVADTICKHRKEKILITFYERKHGELMYNTFIERYPTLAHLAEWVHGEDKQRAEKIAAYINNEKRILFASTILQQGINISDMQVGINAIGEKAAITLSQFIGRMERTHGDATHFTWYDLFDQGKYMTKHSKKRIQLYKNENYPIPIEYMYNAGRTGIPLKSY